MATTARVLTRAIRSTSTASAFKTATPSRLLTQNSRRGYSSQLPKPKSNTVLYGGIAAAVLAGAGYYGVTTPANKADAVTVKASSAAGASKGLVVPTFEDYQKVYAAIAKKLVEEDDYDDGSYGPVLLRLGWHASGTYDKETGTGGSNGATMRFPPEGDHGANAGLKAARDFLEPVHKQFQWITYSDLWTLAAVCAIQEMGGPDIKWRPGRQDRDVSFCTPDGRLPDGAKAQDHLRSIFGRMGFNDAEIVALSGAHALGRCHTDRSGFEGPWTFSPITMTNDYYKLLLDEKWMERKWNGPRQFQDSSKTLMMLPSDMALVQDKGFKQHVVRYAKSQEEFFNDFSQVVSTLFELGVPFQSGEEAKVVFKRTG